MGTWSTDLKGNDTFLDIYQNFFQLYNSGMDPVKVSHKIQSDYAEMFEDFDDKNNSLFGLALAQWETKSLDSTIFKQVKEIIESEKDLENWIDGGTENVDLKKRKSVLGKFLSQISVERPKPKRRVKEKFIFNSIDLVRIIAPDNKKVFYACEYGTNGIYSQTGSGVQWDTGGGSVFYFREQGKFVDARWIDSHTLEVIHDKDIVFTKKNLYSNYCEDSVTVIYIPR